MVDNFHCGNEFAGTWCLQIRSVAEVGQGEIQCEMPGCWAWCGSYAQSYKQRGEGLGSCDTKSYPHFQSHSQCQHTSRLLWRISSPLVFFGVYHSFDSFLWNEFGKTLT